MAITEQFPRHLQGIPSFPEEASTPMQGYGAAQIVENVAGGILKILESENPSALKEEDVLGFLKEGGRRIEKDFNIREAQISNVNVLGAARVKLAIEEMGQRRNNYNYNPKWIPLIDVYRTTVDWLERITQGSPNKS